MADAPTATTVGRWLELSAGTSASASSTSSQARKRLRRSKVSSSPSKDLSPSVPIGKLFCQIGFCAIRSYSPSSVLWPPTSTHTTRSPGKAASVATASSPSRASSSPESTATGVSCSCARSKNSLAFCAKRRAIVPYAWVSAPSLDATPHASARACSVRSIAASFSRPVCFSPSPRAVTCEESAIGCHFAFCFSITAKTTALEPTSTTARRTARQSTSRCP